MCCGSTTNTQSQHASIVAALKKLSTHTEPQMYSMGSHCLLTFFATELMAARKRKLQGLRRMWRRKDIVLAVLRLLPSPGCRKWVTGEGGMCESKMRDIRGVQEAYGWVNTCGAPISALRHGLRRTCSRSVVLEFFICLLTCFSSGKPRGKKKGPGRKKRKKKKRKQTAILMRRKR